MHGIKRKCVKPMAVWGVGLAAVLLCVSLVAGQGSSDAGPREGGPRDRGARENGPRENGPREGRARRGGEFSKERFIKHMLTYDKNGDGKIAKSEAPSRMKENFGRADQNADGFVDRKELDGVAQDIAKRGGPRRGDRPNDKPSDRPNKAIDKPDDAKKTEALPLQGEGTIDDGLVAVSATKLGGIAWFATLDPALAEAKRTGKPILLLSAAPHCHDVSGIW
jgi:hypothetical protein